MRHCLQLLGLKPIHTSELRLSQDTIELLESNQRAIVHGHISNIPRPADCNQKQLQSDILKSLYFKSDRIIPTRNPSNLLQSWMHYAKTRANMVLSRVFATGGEIIVENKDLHMIFKMSKLKQDCLVFSDDGLSIIKKGKSFPVFRLKEVDEAVNLHAFADFLFSNIDYNTLGQLCSMQAEVFAPVWPKIEGAMRRGKSVKIQPPLSNEDRNIFYYDIENILPQHCRMLDELVCTGFSNELTKTKLNKSENKNELKGCELDSLGKKLRKMVPTEWLIYEQSKVLKNF